MKKRLAISFHNGLGNLLFMSAAVKVLRNWGYDDITLITDEGIPPRNYQFAKTIGAKIFDNVVTSCEEGMYDKIFICGWSAAGATSGYQKKHNYMIRTINWNETGLHEVMAYLSMIGASWKDFDGYILDVADTPLLSGDKPRIALANPSGSGQADKKAWDKFPELSEKLVEMGYDVYLLGWGDELKGCSGHNYVGKLSIEESAKVLAQCDLLIAASTALTVIADHVKTPVLLIEGPMTTSRAHPVMSRYDIVRKYISCAPCFQTGLWQHCSNNQCMTRIEVNDVVSRMFKFMPKLKEKQYSWTVGDLKFKPDSTVLPKVDKRVAYLISCQDRYFSFKQFVDSLKNSNLLPGTAFFWNDDSTDLRVKQEIQNLSIDNVEIRYFETPFGYEKFDECKIQSTRVGNLLFKALRDVSKDEKYHYVAYMDSDIILKPNWAQKLISTFEAIGSAHKAWCITGLNNGVDYFNKEAHDPKIYESPYGKYRVRGGACIHFMIPINLFLNEVGWFSQDVRSSDISKSDEMLKKGYKCLVAVPSLVQHIGVLDSSFRDRAGVIAEDFE